MCPMLSEACLCVRPPGAGVCRVCCGALEGHLGTCSSCRRIAIGLRSRLHPVTPISLTTRATGLYAALKQYKGKPNSVSQRQQRRIAELAGEFLGRHTDCVAPCGYDVVTVVPSFQVHSGHHPLEGTLRMVPSLAPKIVDALFLGPVAICRNVPAPDAYRCRRELVEQRRVLLVDDTYTTGAHLHSAASTLEGAGARSVHLLVVGRHQRLEWEPARRLLDLSALSENRWTIHTCARCK